MVFFCAIGLIYSLSIPEQYDIIRLAEWEAKYFGMLKTIQYSLYAQIMKKVLSMYL